MNASSSSRRLYLRVATKLLFTAGAVAVGALFLGYLVSGTERDDARKDRWTRPIDVRGVEEGELRLFDWPGGTIGVYRRTAAQIDGLRAATAALTGPEAERIRALPAAARRPGRSRVPEYFVFMAQTPGRGCRVRLAERPPPESTAWRGGFYDPCGGTWFDHAGRVQASAGKGAGDLVVPGYRYVAEGRIRLDPPR